jgi:hypothetical protein
MLKKDDQPKMLTKEEQQNVLVLFMHGWSGLFESGLSFEEVKAFTSRVEVHEYLELLNNEFKTHDDVLARQKFIMQRLLGRMTTQALHVIRQSLEGPTYARGGPHNAVLYDAEGNYVVKEAAPTNNQLRAAHDLLDRLGVNIEQPMPSKNELNVTQIINNHATPAGHLGGSVAYDDGGNLTEAQRALSREKRRNLLDGLRKHVPAQVEKVNAKLFGKKTKLLTGAKVSNPAK